MLSLYLSPVYSAGVQALLQQELRVLTDDQVKDMEHFDEGLIVRLRRAGNDSSLGLSSRTITPLLERTAGKLLVLAETADFFELAPIFGCGVRYLAILSSSRTAFLAAVGEMQECSEAPHIHTQVKRLLEQPQFSESLQNRLTHRERQVAAAMTGGLSNKQIARVFGISYETVKEHVQHILRKLECTDRTQVATKLVRFWEPRISLPG